MSEKNEGRPVRGGAALKQKTDHNDGPDNSTPSRSGVTAAKPRDPLAEAAKRSLGNGWSPIPIAWGKKFPSVKEWETHCKEQPTVDLIDEWAADDRLGGVGLAGGPHGLGLDGDARDPRLSRAIERLARRYLGDAKLRREGLPPKFLLPYRGAPGFELRKRVIKLPPLLSNGPTGDPVLDEEGKPIQQRVELLARGQQFVAFGWHTPPDEERGIPGRKYEWTGPYGEGEGPSPASSEGGALDEQPEIDEEKWAAFEAAVLAYARLYYGDEAMDVLKQSGSNSRERAEADSAPATPMSPAEFDQACDDLREALMGKGPDGSPFVSNELREEWLEVGAALKLFAHECCPVERRFDKKGNPIDGPGEEVLEWFFQLWTDWSRDEDSLGYEKFDPEDQAKTWKDLRTSRAPGEPVVTVASIFHLAEEAGLPNPARVRAREGRAAERGDARADFEGMAVPAEQQARDQVAAPKFKRDQNGKPLPKDRSNMEKAIEALGVRLSYDEFAERALIQIGDAPPRHLDDAAMLRVRWSIDERFGFRPAKDELIDLASYLALQNSFHPVRDYLDGLTWDGEKRIDRWLSEYGGAPDNEYTRAVGALVLVADVRRVRRPGCKFDELAVLEAAQGTLKSSALKALCPREDWYLDDLPVGADSKVVIERTLGKWLVEAAELSGMQRRAVERVKAFASRAVDGPARMAYARLPVERPRQFIVIGTTNDSAYLKDSTGNRRFWPVKVARFDVKRLRADRDQLWAEAAAREAAGESIRLKEELWPLAGVEQEQRRVADAWEPALADKLGARDDPGRLCGKLLTEDAWAMVGKADPGQRQQHDNERLGKAIRALGFERRTLRLNGRTREWYVRFPDGEDDRERQRRDPRLAALRLPRITLDGGLAADDEELPSRRENGRLLR